MLSMMQDIGTNPQETMQPEIENEEAVFAQQQEAGQKSTQGESYEPVPGQLGDMVARLDQGDITTVYLERTTGCGVILPVNFTFDRSKWQIEINEPVQFLHPPDPGERLGVEEFQSLANRYVDIANERLNGWYKLRVDHCKTEGNSSCESHDIPIRINIFRSEKPGARRVILSNKEGRSHVYMLYAKDLGGGISNGTLGHEAAHLALGASDEYEEKGKSCKEGKNVDNDHWSLLSDHCTYGKRAKLLPRHFSHIAHWFEKEFPQYTVSLVPLDRSAVIAGDLNLEIGGGTDLNHDGIPLYVRSAFKAGLPIDAMRHAELMLGGQYTTMGITGRVSFLAGLTLGLDYARNRSAGGPAFGIEGGINAGMVGRGAGAGIEGGIQAGYADPTFNVYLTARLGLLTGDSQTNSYFILGVRVGYNLINF